MSSRTVFSALVFTLGLGACSSAGISEPFGIANLKNVDSTSAFSFGIEPSATRAIHHIHAPSISTKGLAPGYNSARLGPNTQAMHLLHLIAAAEAGPAGYDAIQHGARQLPAKRPTQMTLAEIYAWIDATPRQNHAIGRYQFIPKTLKHLVKQIGVRPNQPFTPQVQDALADILLQDAGFGAFKAGKLGRRTFMNNLARIWAGLPTSNGQSHYHGYAGNRATISWATFDTEMARIFSN